MAFREWENKRSSLFSNASFWRKRRHCWMMSKNKHHVFRWETSEVAPLESEMVYASAFTESFPSTHDMPEWALSARMADILVLRGVSVKDSAQYRIVIRNHFYNHNLVRAIIEFDLYRLTK